MKCTACDSPIYYRDEENTKNRTCWNMNCPARVKANYFCNVSVMPNWWFAENYHLPFKYENIWYCIVGPTDEIPIDPDHKLTIDELTKPEHEPRKGTTLQKIDTFDVWRYIETPFPCWECNVECSQRNIWTIPYMALPVNDDFQKEFEALKWKFSRYLHSYRSNEPINRNLQWGF